MKLGLPAKLAIFLLMASPFVYAEFECLPLAGTTQFMSVSGTDGCPQRSFKLVNGTQCEVVLHEPQCSGVEGEWFGTYRYTGSVFNENPTDPVEPDPTDPNVVIKTPDPVTVAYQADTSRSVTEFSEKMAAALNTLSLNQKSLSVESQQNKHQILDVMGQYNTQMANRVTGARDTVLSLRDYIIQQETVQAVKSDASFQKVYDKQDIAQESLDSISTTLGDLNLSASLENIEANIGGFYNELNYVMIGQNQSAIRETELNSKTDALRNISLSAYDVSLNNRSSLQQLSSDVYQLSYQISEISDMLQDDNPPPSCGGMMEPPCEPCGGILGPECPPDGGDTGGSFSSLDSENLQTVAHSSLETVQAVRSVGRGIDNVDNALGELGQQLDGIKGSLDALSDTSGFADDLAQGTAQGKSDLNQLLDGYDADKMLTDRFKAITDEAEKTLKDSGLSKFSDPSKFIDDSGMVKPDTFDDLVAFAQRQPCSPYQMTIRGNSYQMDLCPYAADASAILTYVFAVLTAIFCFVMISQTLINERLS